MRVFAIYCTNGHIEGTRKWARHVQTCSVSVPLSTMVWPSAVYHHVTVGRFCVRAVNVLYCTQSQWHVSRGETEKFQTLHIFLSLVSVGRSLKQKQNGFYLNKIRHTVSELWPLNGLKMKPKFSAICISRKNQSYSNRYTSTIKHTRSNNQPLFSCSRAILAKPHKLKHIPSLFHNISLNKKMTKMVGKWHGRTSSYQPKPKVS